MTDPRNVAHDKKVQQEKKNRDEEVAPGAEKTPQPGKKPHMERHASDTAKVPDEASPVPTEEKPLGGQTTAGFAYRCLPLMSNVRRQMPGHSRQSPPLRRDHG